jgi:hypothetical protein
MHFFMDYDVGAFRRDVVQQLRDVYQDRATAGGLAALTGMASGKLDTLYRDSFLPIRDSQLNSIQASQAVFKLSLGHCSVTDRGIQSLQDAAIDSLVWLDLNQCAVGDDGLMWIARATRLRQLFLADTRISDVTLGRLTRLSHLEELDLSGTQITDDGLKQLAGLRSLRLLWVTDTAVSDGAIAELRESLSGVDIRGD